MEAERSAPAPLPGLALELRRTEPWRPGRPAGFVALYARKADVGHGLTATVEFDGRMLKANFKDPADQLGDVRRAATLTGAVVLSTLVVAFSLFTAVQHRIRLDRDLAHVEVEARRDLRVAQRDRQVRASEATLKAKVGAMKPASDAANAMDLAVKARLPTDPVEAIHWRPEGVALEIRGPQDAYPAAAGTRAETPLRPGVWLWIHKPAAPR